MLMLRDLSVETKAQNWIGVVRSSRLRLEPATMVHHGAELKDRASLGDVLGATVPESWPPQIVPPPHRGAASEWVTLYVLHENAGEVPIAIGVAGMARWVGGETMQFGGSLLREWQRDGLGAELTVALADWAMQQDGVKRIVCDIPEAHHAAAKCLRKAGYAPLPDRPTEGFVRWERKRA